MSLRVVLYAEGVGEDAGESLAPGVAKAALTRIVNIAPSSSNLQGSRRTRLIRRDIAASSDLSLLAQLRSFGTLLHDLTAALA